MFKAWRTSTYSGTQGQCVEVSPAPGAVGVRDTKNRGNGHLVVPRSAWTAFVRHVSR